MARYRVRNRFSVDPQADPSAVRRFAEALKKYGSAHYGPGEEGQPGELPFYVDVEADTPEQAIEVALTIVDPRADLQRWLRYVDRWSLPVELPVPRED